jgi:hypothetical protein
VSPDEMQRRYTKLMKSSEPFPDRDHLPPREKGSHPQLRL